jgi:hypothetical protein
MLPILHVNGSETVPVLVFSLCYLFCRCTRSISIVPPVAYAHLAAKRARCLMDEVTVENEGTQLKVSLGQMSVVDPSGG